MSVGQPHTARTGWILHPAWWVISCSGLILTCLGLLSGRTDVALLGVPLVLIAAWPLPPSRVTVGIRSTDDAQTDQLVISDPGSLVRLRLSCDGHRIAQVLVGGSGDPPFGRMTRNDGRTTREDNTITREYGQMIVCTELASVHTGPQPVMRADWDAHSPFLTAYTRPLVEFSESKLVLPHYIPLRLVPESRRLRGLTGPATSTRPGDGFELRDVHPMGPSDTLRRIDWRVTARQTDDTLWVKGTYTTGEAVAVLVMDSRDEVGPDLHTWHGLVPLRVDEPTSLDLARHAAASIARRLIESGDRVGLADMATPRRLLAPATGRRHLNRLIYSLALSSPVGSPRMRVRPPQVPADALVYLFSTLLDDESARLVHAWTNTGHQVVVVDTLPVVRPVAEVNLELAWRITRAERQMRIRRLVADHVPVLTWAGPRRDEASEKLETIRRTWMRLR